MTNQVDPEFMRLLKMLNEVTINIDNAEKLIEDSYHNLQRFKNLRDKVLNLLNEHYPESSRN
jgi:hypothetical protein